MTKAAMIAVIAALSGGPALAQDWTGGWGGIRLGYGDVDVGGTPGDGALYGLGAGYDYDFGDWVLGGVVNYDWSDIGLDGGVGTIDSVARVGIRAGADMGQSLLYATAGAAQAEATVGGTGYSDTGWYAGIGAEYLLSGGFSLSGELLTHKFDDFDGTGLDVDATTLTLGANFRF